MTSTPSPAPVDLTLAEQAVDRALDAVGRHLVLAAPLGLGKPNHLLNAFYRRAAADRAITLTILTALSLEVPRPASDIEARLLEPYLQRHFGDYEELEYMRDLRAGTLPDNVTVHEFYFRAGSMLNVASAQRHYISTNYTFVARDLFERGVNVLVQLVAEREVDGKRMLSLSCSTDVTLDLIPMLQAARAAGRRFLTVAQVHDDLPFLYNRALVEPELFDAIVRDPAGNTRLFATPNMSIAAADHAIGLHVSALIQDGGTLQIGIGSLGDAVVYSCLLRQSDNDAYRKIVAGLGANHELIERTGGLDRFAEGLYGCSEMFVSGFLHLRRAGILSREVFDEPRLQSLLNAGLLRRRVDDQTLRVLIDAGIIAARLGSADVEFLRHWGIFKTAVRLDGATLVSDGVRMNADLTSEESYRDCCRHALGTELAHGIFLHGGFFLGPADFYQALRDMPRAEIEKIGMDSVRRINRLDDPVLQSLQRRRARFINTAMMVTLGGAVVSDGLENGQVVSGVGGQYNFVAQAHELADARSIICLRAARERDGTPASNIVFAYGHTTIPRHLRDIVVTEYGAADLRGRSDEEIVAALLAVADSRFQDDLLAAAVRAGKISTDYRIPERHRDNRPERIQGEIGRWRGDGCFPPFPLGTDFTPEEIALAQSLRDIKDLMGEPWTLIRAVVRSFAHDVDETRAAAYLERIGLAHPNTPKEVVLQHLLLLELEERGLLRPL